MLLQKQQKLVMIGDSITDAGRTQPEGLSDPMGRGYVTLIEALLGSTYPQLGIRILNTGISGHTSRDLNARWQKDVLDHKPDWVSCMIGTNDVWRQFDLPRMKELHVLPEEYRNNLDSLLSQTRPAVKGFVLMTPFFMEPSRQDAMRKRMDEYGQIVKEIAHKYDAILVDTQAAFDEVMEHYYSATLGWDRVHPTQTGHMILARAFLNSIGYQW